MKLKYCSNVIGHHNRDISTGKECQSRIDNYCKIIIYIKFISNNLFLLKFLVKSLNNGNTVRRQKSENKHANNDKPMIIENLSLMDPRLETLDPTPDIQRLYREFDSKFFENKLSNQKNFNIIWCNRLTTSAGIFTAGYMGRGNERRWRQEIRLSSKLLSLRPRSDLINTLLHEMIHAYIYFANIRDTDSHGQYFQEFMWKINQIAHTNITVYHNFHDEVKYAQNGGWKRRNQDKQPKKPNQSLLDGWLIQG
ncbi:sprT-like protein domain-containing protein [Euroglyphus maynei]|uniref:SprT-like protein domain-containing protein n=1 Tax=Euroglyphus maynei TaxID=6958 RepID=A0A1Y3BK03_EURMA|nr:sprT-like protein domain-containing protein [Euroglyphus maynei]